MNIKAVFFDLDGTLYFNQKAIEGAIETVDYLKSKGYICRFLTNSDSKRTSYILERVKNLGFNIELDEIFTPVTASVKFLKSNREAKIYTLVSDNVVSEYEEFNLCEENVDYIVIGDCRDKVSYDILNKAFKIVGENTEILALQKGKYFYDSTGKNLDTGAFVAMMEYATGKSSKVLGKPSESFFNILLQDLNLKPSDVLIIGDDISTDIVGANNIGSVGALVKTGKYNDQINLHVGNPDLVLDSVADLMRYL